MAKNQKKPLCYGQKFGHDFPAPGGQCSKCGISQNELSEGFKKIEYFRKQPAKGIHSETHALAKEISEFSGEPKKFGMYLGIIKNIGLPRAYKIFAELKQSKDVETPGKLFVYLSAQKQKAGKEPARSKYNSAPLKEKIKKRKKYFYDPLERKIKPFKKCRHL